MLEAIDEKSIVFGLDIGTRSIVGTVGYKDGERFRVIAQAICPHRSRSMIDGQIHDIAEVGKTILEVKENLEEQLGIHLYEVCIAAAGRVLKTVPIHMEHEFDEDTVITSEHLHTMDLMGVDQASVILNEVNDTQFDFYSVGYSTTNYYADDDLLSSILGHKARKMSEDMIVTFLPEDVVDGLYSAVNMAGLEVSNMTLEPIAAINVAIPKSYRTLNLALVDVGAGTSDISVTKDGSIVAYGMIPQAGDELTDILVQRYLVDFDTAEAMKIASGTEEEVEFKDILQIPHTVKSSEILEAMKPVISQMTKDVANCIKELNGDKSVSAVFVVGGGGKVKGYTESLAKELGLIPERVALRGEEVLNIVEFNDPKMVRDSLMVTPVGICLSAYEKKNNFIIVYFNDVRMKLYDNDKLTIMDAAVQAGFPNSDLFPKSGKELRFTVNGRQRLVRGGPGEPAVILMDGRAASLGEPLVENCRIEIASSTEGEAAHYTIGEMEEYTKSNLSFVVNGKMVLCPKFAKVNGRMVSEFYEIQSGDVIELQDFYTLRQLIEFMDVEIDTARELLVNRMDADFDTEVYENFSVEWTQVNYMTGSEEASRPFIGKEAAAKEVVTDIRDREIPENANTEETSAASESQEAEEIPVNADAEKAEEKAEENSVEEKKTEQEAEDPFAKFKKAEDANFHDILPRRKSKMVITVNGAETELSGKDYYIFVDVFDAIHFDLTAGRGRSVVTKLNGKDAQYTELLKAGDSVEVYWA